MYDPTNKDELLMKAYEDLGYWAWWNGYNISSNITTDLKNIVLSLVSKGWIKEIK